MKGGQKAPEKLKSRVWHEVENLKPTLIDRKKKERKRENGESEKKTPTTRGKTGKGLPRYLGCGDEAAYRDCVIPRTGKTQKGTLGGW